jgi:hypothetical protein
VLLDVGLCLLKHAVALWTEFGLPLAYGIELTLDAPVLAEHDRAVFRRERRAALWSASASPRQDPFPPRR